MSRQPFVFLGQPGYGQLTAGAARAFWRASRLPDDAVYRQYNEGSLLAANFNALWVSALNLARAGRAPDYFAMLHADVEPQDWWLDTLIDELEDKNLDVLSAVVPIKDSHGLTSTALSHPDGDPFRILCRLTMADVHRLPETFTSDDVGHPLLLNTGLWVCRFDEAWTRKVRFTINDRIVTLPDGSYRAQCEPEDWYFSRLCHELGLKLGATRKVKLEHRGTAAFTNDRPWGQPFDAAYTDHSPLDDVTGRFVLPNIPGWLRYEEGAALAELARGKRVLEIGSYCGLSTVCVARTAECVTAIDTWDGRGTPHPRDTFEEFLANIRRYGVSDKVSCSADWRASTNSAYIQFSRACDYAGGTEAMLYDLAFIDGAHDRESVEADIERARDSLAKGGLLAFHDYASPADPDVTAAVDALLARGGELVSLTGTLAVVRPPAPVPEPLEV